MREQIAKLAQMDRWLDTKGRTRTSERTDVQIDTDIQANLAIESRYETVRFLDRGGLGIVCVGHDERLHRDVALKFIDEHHAALPECLQQFLVEAEVTSRLEHPGVVPVYGVGQTSTGRPFYAMRFIQGETLDVAIERFHNASRSGEQGAAAAPVAQRASSPCATRSPTPTTGASCTATSSRPTSCWAATARRSSSIGDWRCRWAATRRPAPAASER